MVIIVIFLGGAIHGAFSGLGLSAIDPLAPKGRYIYSAAITKGNTKGLLILIFILVITTQPFTHPSLVSASPQIAADSTGCFHLAWMEESGEDPLLPVGLGGEVRIDQ